MSDDNSVIDIKILDRTYKIKCTSDEARELQESAKYLDEQMRKVRQTGQVMNTDRVAVVTALNICNELLQLKQQQTQSLQTIKQRIQDLRERVKNFLATEEEIAV